MTVALSMDFPAGFQINVQTTSNRGFTPEEVAERCVERLVHVSDSAPPAIRDQAIAFRDSIKAVVTFYMQEAVKSDRTTVYNALTDAGHPDLAKLIRSL